MKSAIQQAAEFYEQNRMNFATDLEYHLKWGCLICLPDRFIMAREISLADGPQVYCERNKGDTWFVHYAFGKGALRWFLSQAPRRLPYLAWFKAKYDKPELRVYPIERFEKKLHA